MTVYVRVEYNDGTRDVCHTAGESESPLTNQSAVLGDWIKAKTQMDQKLGLVMPTPGPEFAWDELPPLSELDAMAIAQIPFPGLGSTTWEDVTPLNKRYWRNKAVGMMYSIELDAQREAEKAAKEQEETAKVEKMAQTLFSVRMSPGEEALPTWNNLAKNSKDGWRRVARKAMELAKEEK